MADDFNNKLALLFGVEPKHRPVAPRPHLKRPLPEPVHTRAADRAAETAQLNRVIQEAWRTHEGRDRICQLLTNTLQEGRQGHRLLRDCLHEPVPMDYYDGTEPQTFHVTISNREVWMSRIAGDMIRRAMDQLTTEVSRYMLDSYYTALYTHLRDDDWTDPSDIAGYGGNVLLKPSHEREFEWVRRYLDDGIYSVSEGLPWDAPLWTRDLGRMRQRPIRVGQMPNLSSDTTTLMAITSVSYTFPLPVYRVRGF